MSQPASVPITDAPAIPGLTFRRFRGAADYPEMLRVREGCRERDQIDRHAPRAGVPTRDDLARALADTPAGTPDLLLAEVDGQLVGYNHVTSWTEEDGTTVYLHLGWLSPEWRGAGIGSAMFGAAEARCRERATTASSLTAAVYATNATSAEREATALTLANGYSVVRRLADMKLMAPLPTEEPPLPTGVEARPVVPDHYLAIFRGFRAIWTGLWGVERETDDTYREFLDDMVNVPGYHPDLWRIAWSGDEVVGLVFCHLYDGFADVTEVGARADWQRRGLARALLVRAMRAVPAHGVEDIRIVTDAEDGRGARSLYESVGFRGLKEHVLYRKPMQRAGQADA
ncbi:MAG: GNAT family N-acetyltransferase [Ktedonobacterales bacterium]